MNRRYAARLVRRLLGCGALLLAGMVRPGGAAYGQEASRPGARLAFPNHGTVNAFVLFVQHADEPDGAGVLGDDPDTEWPVAHSLGPDRRLPAWAEAGRLLAPPDTPPDAYDAGSLSAFYHLMSQGRFHLTGYVYPRVYVPRHPVAWYHANRGAFVNGAVKLAHEILTSEALQTYFDDNPDGLDLATLDAYRNGANAYPPGGDGVFDLIVLVHRGVTLPRLRLSYKDTPLGGSSISSFGADVEFRPDHPEDYRDPAQDAFASAPVTLGGLRVIDNATSGSGITTHALTRKQAVRIIAHEIGHRQFGFYHTCEGPLSPASDCIGVMGGAYVTMSAGDRIKLGWAEVVPLDVPTLGRMDAVFPDALASGRVFRLRVGADRCGDLIVEARFWSNFWDSPPNADRPDAPFYGNDDGDDGDLFLPQEGLYLYKAPEAGNLFCGGNPSPEYDEQRYSSLENSGLGNRLVPFRDGPSNDLKAFRPGGTYRTAYAPGDTYAPFARPRFFFHEHPALDAKLSLTNITRRDGAFSAEIWTDYLAAPPEQDRLRITSYPNPFSDRATIRYEVTDDAFARLTVYDLLGRRVATLAEGRHRPGIHEAPFDATGLPDGLYWCRVEVGRRTRTHALHLLRTGE